VVLYRALGGGWQEASPQAAASGEESPLRPAERPQLVAKQRFPFSWR
jgi:hypothetical protein